MTGLDWWVLLATVLCIVVYGVWKTRHVNDIEGYFRGDSNLPWTTIGLSVMATQASAITFLSMPGQAYDDGMRFLQVYLGLPLAMVVISAYFVPIYYRLKVYTAYEYLEHRLRCPRAVPGRDSLFDSAWFGHRHHHLCAIDYF